MTSSEVPSDTPSGLFPIRLIAPAAWLLGAILMVSCAGHRYHPPTHPPPPISPPVPPPAVMVESPPVPTDSVLAFSEPIRGRARATELQGDLRKARFLWTAILRLAPGDEEASRRSAILSERLKSAALLHFGKGVAHHKAGATAAARREFLLTLANDPAHPEALEYLRNRLEAPDFVEYETREGDTLRRIAREKYDDPGKEGLIAYYNGLDGNGVLRPGILLKLPVLEPVPVQERIGKGGKNILAYPGEFEQAEAERHYRNGLRSFQSSEFEKAAADWEKTLALDPEHANARRDLERLQRLLRKLK